VRRETRAKHHRFAGNFVDRDSLDLVQHGQNPYSNYFPDSAGLDGSPDSASEASVEELYQELDGAVVHDHGLTSRLCVLGIHEVGAERWIQMSADGSTVHNLVLHVAHTARRRDLIASIEAQLANPVSTSDIIHIS
jgi:hypothetical protein